MNNPGVETITVSTPGKIAIVTFDANAGTQAEILLTESTIASGVMRVFYPDGSAMPATSFGAGGGYWPVVTFNVTGTYTIAIDPDASYVGSVKLHIGMVDFTVSGLAVNAVSVNQDGSYNISVVL